MEDFSKNTDIVSFLSGTQGGNTASSLGRVFGARSYRGSMGSLTSQTQFNAAMTLCSTSRPISFEADRDCFCFTSIGLLMVCSL